MTTPTDHRSRLELQARMFDLGHPVDEAATNRVIGQLDPQSRPSDAELHRAASDDYARQAIQESFA